MSYTDNSGRQWQAETSLKQREADGLVRRMAIKLTSGVFWQAVGHLLMDNVTREAPQAEVFSGIGFYGRPKSGHRAEAIVVFPGGAANPVIIATRDEDARKAMAQIAEDETAVFNSQTIILIKADGTVEIRRANGTAVALATKADVESVDDKYKNHVHFETGGATSGPVAVASIPPVPLTPANVVGTTVLKAQ